MEREKTSVAKKLSPKLAGRDYVENLGLKVPELYWKGKDLKEIPDLDNLPQSFVLKPEKDGVQITCIV